MHIIIIAEIGINHGGNIETAKKLIKGAKDAGVDAIKFQKRSIERVYDKDLLLQPRVSPWGNTQGEQKRGLELGKVEYDIINAYCKMLDIDWFASIWDLESLEFLKQYNLKYNKVASPLITHKALMTAIAKQKKYTFISTGMSTYEEIDNVVNIFREEGCPYELMHCNSVYPMPNRDANLNTIISLERRYNCKVGYSGHSSGIIDAIGAAALGVTSIEKHICLDRTAYGSDMAASLEPNGLRKMVEYIRTIEEMLGNGIKVVTPTEEEVKKKLRRYQDY